MDERLAIYVKDLTRSFGTFRAVDGLTFSVGKGEIFGLLGPNGAGKTTTLSMMSGLVRPTGGKLLVNGVDMRKRPRDVRPAIGIVPQTLALYTSLTARDNLSFFGGLYGLRGNRLRRRIEGALRVAGLTDRAGDIVDTFSGGMKRRLNLAVALVHKPSILFLDEPTVGVDPQSRNAIFESVEKLRHDGMTVVYTTHYMEEAERLCDRVAIVDHGKVVAIDEPERLKQIVGGDCFTVELDTADVGALVSMLRASPTIRDVRVSEPGQLEIEATEVQDALMHLVESARTARVSIKSMSIARPSLEMVFLRLTGSSLRDT